MKKHSSFYYFRQFVLQSHSMEISQIALFATLFVSLYFEVFLLITYFEHLQNDRNTLIDIDEDALPTATVIVPCFNEEKTVGATLESLLQLTYPKNKLRIIAVNDGSSDNTLSILKTFEHHNQITVLDKKNGGKHSAMNMALKYSDSEIIGCLDADSYVEHDALLYIAKQFEDIHTSAVTPSIKIHNPQNILQLVQKAEYGLAIFVRNVFAHMDSLFITPGPFSFFRRSVILEVGPWRHGHSTEDLEMCLRLQQHNKKITNEPRAIVHTTSPKTFKALYNQRVRWTFGFLKNAVDYRHMFFNGKYGTLGLFILPLSLVSIFSATFLFATLLWNTGVKIVEEIVRFQTVGVQVPSMQFDMFYFNTTALSSIVFALLALTFVLISIGKKISKDKIFSFDIPLYIALYGFITPLWLAGSLYKVVVKDKVRWR